MENKNNRTEISQKQIDAALASIGNETQRRLIQKGFGTLASTHEILGIITEEFDELKDSVRSNNINEIVKEIHDIAVACHFAIACINSDTLDF